MRHSSRPRSRGCATRSLRRTPRNRATSKSPETRCFAAACAPCAPFRMCKSRGPPAGSSSARHQVDEDVFQRALAGIEISEADAGFVEILKQCGDAGALALRIVVVDESAAVSRQCQAMGSERIRHGIELLMKVERQLLVAELVHQLDLVL